MDRRNFLKNSVQAGLAISAVGLTSCLGNKENKTHDGLQAADESLNDGLFFKLSLAQWSLHKAILENQMDPTDFAAKAHQYGFEGLEYVNQLYGAYFQNDSNSLNALKKLVGTLNQKAKDYGMQNVLIMIDNEGTLSSADSKLQLQAIDNHKKWMDAAHELGCHSIRVNLFGDEREEVWKEKSVESLLKLAEYGNPLNVDVIVENHGGFSSNGVLIAEVMKMTNNPHCGILPDFGNFCLKRDTGDVWEGNCIEEYDRYLGVSQMMTYAKGVSAKTFDFDAAGNETLIDFKKMLKIVKDSGFNGFIGSEYEGDRLSEEEGIIATKKLLIKTAKELNG
ncbi:MAG: sugar phosphate isomerase/epimerase family protein [Flavobacteriaceae bacterium]|nr:sugar phosphate isomerase/epimerase family protein [Flavobacteriaceae bacterium]